MCLFPDWFPSCLNAFSFLLSISLRSFPERGPLSCYPCVLLLNEGVFLSLPTFFFLNGGLLMSCFMSCLVHPFSTRLGAYPVFLVSSVSYCLLVSLHWLTDSMSQVPVSGALFLIALLLVLVLLLPRTHINRVSHPVLMWFLYATVLMCGRSLGDSTGAFGSTTSYRHSRVVYICGSVMPRSLLLRLSRFSFLVLQFLRFFSLLFYMSVCCLSSHISQIASLGCLSMSPQ